MKKILYALIIILLGYEAGFAAEKKDFQSSMTIYKDNYFLFSDIEHQTKLQLSTKFNLFYPSDTGLYFGYTQLSNWFVYNWRDTFYTMYQPEVFYRFTSGENIFGDYAIPYVDYFQISPFYHCSTGTETAEHRSMNHYYGQLQMSVGDVFNTGYNIRVHNYMKGSWRNADIDKYKKHYEAILFLKHRSGKVDDLNKQELSLTFGGVPWGNGYYMITGKVIIFTAYLQPRLMIQYYNGYGEFMVNYNKKDQALRVGVSLE